VAAVLALLLSGVGQASRCRANTLYTTGPDILRYGSDGLPDVTGGYADLDHFTLASNSAVKQIRWSEWVATGATPTSVDWAITTNLAGGGGTWTGTSNVVASGTTTLTSSLTASGLQGGNDVYESTFHVNVPLSAGTYYLWLGNATDSFASDIPGWGYANQNGGNAEQWYNGNSRVGLSGDLSFEIDGVPNSASAAPEPASLTLLGIGAAGLLAHGPRKRRQARV
jgi:hypothetical protein